MLTNILRTQKFRRNLFSHRPYLHGKAWYTKTTDTHRGQERIPLAHKQGDFIHGYEVLEKQNYPERNITAYHLKHQKTGARHLHLECSDTNNVFMVTFKTSPTDSSGVAHVLEHTALCGSRKYPIRDPFFNMLRRSLQTYMNAWTGSDYTSYPFSTQNKKDFYNLLSVYLDAAFFPKLEKFDFLQEGHRLEFQQLEDPSSPLEFKGVVYNEMKGSMADSSNLFYHNLTEKLFPTITYKYNSGGNPENILDLTWDQLKDFHKTHYHPSNSYTCTYGDLPLAPHLDFINENVLYHFNQIDPKTDVPNEIRYDTPIHAHVTCPPPAMAGETDKQSKVAVTFLLGLNTDIFLISAFSLLSTLLMTGPNSPMYKSLIESNIGSNYSPTAGFERSTRETFFSIGLQGIRTSDAPKVEQIVLDTLREASEKGFPPDRILALLHQIELSLRHVTTDFGLQTAAAVSHSWIHGGSPLEALSVIQIVQKLSEEIEKGNFFQNLIKKYFLENPHRVTLLMTPDENYTSLELQKEKEKLLKIEQNLNEQEKSRIIEETKILKKRQEETPDPRVLPCVELADIEKEKPKTVLQHDNISSVPIQWSPQPTNGLSYFRAIIDIKDLPVELIPFVSLFSQIWTNMGTKKVNYRDFSSLVEMYTGGLTVENFITAHPTEPEKYSPRLSLSSFCLEKNLPKMFDLWAQLFKDPTFHDLDQLKTLLLGAESDFQESLMDSGHVFARLLAAASLTDRAEISEIWDGLSQYKLLVQLVLENDLEKLSQSLKAISEHVLNRNLMRVAINCESKMFDVTKQALTTFLEDIPQFPVSDNSKEWVIPSNKKQKTKKINSYIGTPANINHTALCFPTVPYNHPDFPKLQVLSHLMTNTYLHREIREKGGAYGGGATHQSGLMAFYSYRDPTVLPTLEHYRNAIEWTVNGNFTDENITEAKLNVFAIIDRPVAPFDKGTSLFTHGISDEMKQLYRTRLFEVNRTTLIEVAYKYLSEMESACAVFGSNQNRNLFENRSGWKYEE